MPPKVVAGCLLLPTLLVAAALLACPRGATAQGVEVTYEGRKNLVYAAADYFNPMKNTNTGPFWWVNWTDGSLTAALAACNAINASLGSNEYNNGGRGPFFAYESDENGFNFTAFDGTLETCINDTITDLNIAYTFAMSFDIGPAPPPPPSSSPEESPSSSPEESPSSSPEESPSPSTKPSQSPSSEPSPSPSSEPSPSPSSEPSPSPSPEPSPSPSSEPSPSPSSEPSPSPSPEASPSASPAALPSPSSEPSPSPSPEASPSASPAASPSPSPEASLSPSPAASPSPSPEASPSPSPEASPSPSPEPLDCGRAAFNPPILSSRVYSQICAAQKAVRQGKPSKLVTNVTLSLLGTNNQPAAINITNIVTNKATAGWQCVCRPSMRDNCRCLPNAVLLGGGNFLAQPQWRRSTVAGKVVDTTLQIFFTATASNGRTCNGTAVICSAWGVRRNQQPPACTPFNSTGVTRPALTCI